MDGGKQGSKSKTSRTKGTKGTKEDRGSRHASRNTGAQPIPDEIEHEIDDEADIEALDASVSLDENV